MTSQWHCCIYKVSVSIMHTECADPVLKNVRGSVLIICIILSAGITQFGKAQTKR